MHKAQPETADCSSSGEELVAQICLDAYQKSYISISTIKDTKNDNS